LSDKGHIDIGLRAKGEVGRKKDSKNIQRKEVRFLILYGIVISFFTSGMVFFLLYLLNPTEKDESNMANAANAKKRKAD
jgi:hypothetical protein